MTEQELDLLMRNVLLDAIAMDEETQIETIPYTPSLHHQKQIKAMLKNPLRWARDRKQPVWKRALKRVAVILLVISLAFGSLMVVSPTARVEGHPSRRCAGILGSAPARRDQRCRGLGTNPKSRTRSRPPLSYKTFSTPPHKREYPASIIFSGI